MAPRNLVPRLSLTPQNSALAGAALVSLGLGLGASITGIVGGALFIAGASVLLGAGVDCELAACLHNSLVARQQPTLCLSRCVAPPGPLRPVGDWTVCWCAGFAARSGAAVQRQVRCLPDLRSPARCPVDRIITGTCHPGCAATPSPVALDTDKLMSKYGDNAFVKDFVDLARSTSRCVLACMLRMHSTCSERA